MNYLAHTYLSFNDAETMIGNLIADFIKGKQIEKYPEAIQKGIKLHRAIDAFTDQHPVVKTTKKLFYNSAGRYGASFLDIAYDHFLALDFTFEPQQGWYNFTQWCYDEVDKRLELYPPEFIQLYTYMKKENWLYNYREKQLIEKNFGRMTRRALYLPDNANVYADFDKSYDQLKESFDIFFPDLKEYVMQTKNFEINEKL